MLRVYAKLGTTEKVITFVYKDTIAEVQKQLNKRYGGEWIFVEMLHPAEGIKFDDGMLYKGFNPKIKRYSKAIIPIL